MKLNFTELNGKTNVNAPIRIKEFDAPEREVFTVLTDGFELYTEGELTGRHRFVLCIGTWTAYEVHTQDGQKNVIVEKAW
jgi:hypothetical protein